MKLRDFMREEVLLLDGGTGTLLQDRGLLPGEAPERWNLTHGREIEELHLSYLQAGSHVICTNTFGANLLHFSPEELDRIISAAVSHARAAIAACSRPGPHFVALDIGPCGRLLRPYGDLPFEDAVSLFRETVRRGVAAGVDLILIETMNDSYETKAALLAAKEVTSLPVFVSNAYGEDGKLMTGATAAAMAAMLAGMGADAIGANCSLGPKALAPVIEELLAVTDLPIILKPNAGLPVVREGRTVYDVTPAEFAEDIAALCRKGLSVVGGCCGTTPDHVAALAERTKGLPCVKRQGERRTVVSSYTHAFTFGARPCLIGERINPTGKKKLKDALLGGDTDYVLSEALGQRDAGADLLDVNAGLPGIEEKEVLTRLVTEIQAVCDLPLVIDTADPSAMERALRHYNGKPLLNSVSGKEESMAAVFPLMKKYGGAVIALTLDENGIPETAEGRVAIARRILERAAAYGIDKSDIIFDTLTMTVSAAPQAALTTLDALYRIKTELGCHTSLGVSNVSFGLPERGALNSTFLALAMQRGLSAAILNPYSPDMMRVYYSYLALSGLDENFANYIENLPKLTLSPSAPTAGATVPASSAAEGEENALYRAIAAGRCEAAAALTRTALDHGRDGLALVNEEIIPALDEIGRAFEEKRAYLPGLLMAAEAAKAAFACVKERMPEGDGGRGRIVLCTVHGDIHDIGKNIVKLLLQNYGFSVRDLGKDVPPETVLEAVLAEKAPLCALSALMTTTVPAMEKTISLLKEAAPWCKTLVGGAVLSRDYAEKIGATYYAKDAMESVRIAEEVFG